MFRRDDNKSRQAASGVARAVSPYAERFAHDPLVRLRVARAVKAAGAAHTRVRRQKGWTGVARRLAVDAYLWRQLREAVVQLRKANEQVEKAQHRRRRRKGMAVVLLVGSGAALASSSTVRRRLQVLAGARSYEEIEQSIDVDVPVTAAYNQWTQFEEFPKFMEGVEEVKQLDDTLLHWAVDVSGRKAEWDALIVDQKPDRRIAWESVDGKRNRGAVTFEPLGPERTRVQLSMSYVSDDPLEHAGGALKLDDRRVRGDLERFRELIESRGKETGAWRGTIDHGKAN
ncbi:MAG TPA: SRPBCC family protein [Gaiellaceae bacterium]|nr:SRPBCC family protein [Gaiellaceae bacterium]